MKRVDYWSDKADYALSRLVYILIFGGYVMEKFVELREEGSFFWAYFMLLCGCLSMVYVYGQLIKGPLVKKP